MTASIIYKGDLRCSAEHLQSGTVIETDAPTDNRGKGERFSPTDMLCVSLATCIVTTMALKANELSIDLKETKIDVTKYMLKDPRRVAKIDIKIDFPALDIDEEKKSILRNAGDNCPVAKSIHPDLVTNISYNW